MSGRARNYAVIVTSAVLAFLYVRLAGDWSDVAFYAGGAGLIAVIGVIGNLWVELARDGSLRQRPGNRPAAD